MSVTHQTRSGTEPHRNVQSKGSGIIGEVRRHQSGRFKKTKEDLEEEKGVTKKRRWVLKHQKVTIKE